MLRTRILSAVALCLVIVPLIALSACNDPSLGQTKQPWAHTDDYMVDQGSVLTVPAATGVLANDEGKGLSCDAGTITTNQGGTVVLAGDGGFTYTPLGLFAGTDVFAYKVRNDGGYDIGAVQITVNPVLPFAIDDSYATTLNTALNVPAASGVLFNDTLNGATITAPAFAPTVVTTMQGGSLLLNADGSFDYTPLAAFTGNDTFTYTLTNPQGTDNATVTIAVRQAPNAVADASYMMSPGATLTVPVGATSLFANDTLGFPVATLTSFGGGSAGGTVTTNTAGNTLVLGTGSLTVNANGSFTFTPDTGFGGNFTFNYRLTNAAGTSDALVTINVDPAPFAVADSSLTATSTVLLSVAAPGLMSNDALGVPAATIASFGGGSMGGAVTDNVAGTPVALGTGSITVNANGSMSFTSNTGFTGNFTFDYRLTNIAGSSDATVTIFVQLGPTAVADSYTTAINTPFTRATTDADDLLDNDMGVPSPTIANFGGGSAGGTVTSNLAGATATFGAGSLTVNANGSFTFTPDTGFIGNFTFQYRAQNAVATSDATVTIAVTQGPTAAPDPSYIATSTVLLVVPAGTGLLANNGVGFPAATVVSFGGNDLGGLVTDNFAGATVPLGSGSLIVRADGSFDFTSNTGFRGNFTFQYRIQNSVGSSDAAVTIEVRLAPGAVADSFNTPPGVPLSVPAGTGALANDERGFPLADVTSFGGGDLGGSVTTNAAGATFAPLPSFSDGSITLNADGSISFTPATGQLGAFSFSYRITNLLGTSDATITISVNQVPVANNDGYNTPVNTTLNVPAGTGLLSNDTLGTPTATLTSFGGGSLPGTVTTNSAGATVAMAGGNLQVNADGSVSLTTPTIIGSYTFLYRLTNTAGTSDAIATIEVRQAPVANDDGTYNVLINTTLSVATSAANDLLDNDTRGFPLANIASFGGGSLGGAVTDNAAGSSVAFAGGTLTINADGSFSVANPTTTGNFTVQYRLTNVVGSDDAIVSIDVRQIPIANDDNPGALYTLTLGGTLTRGAGDLFNDHGAGADVLGFPAATIASFGPSIGNETIAGSSGSTSGGTGLTVNANGSFSYTPVANGTHTFVYRLSNAAGFDTATVTITVNQAPNAIDDPTGGIPGTSSPGSTPFHIAMNGSIVSGTSPNLLTNDTLGFPAAAPASFGPTAGNETTVASATNGTTAAGGTVRVFANGSFNYTPPNATFTGLDSFRYTLTNAGGSDVGIVSLAVGIRPAAANEAYSGGNLVGNVAINTNTGTIFSVLTNDTGDQRVAALVGATNGNATVNADGTFTFNPTAGFEGAATVTYSVSNGFGSVNATVSMTVAEVIWFVDNSQGTNGDGRLGTPFNTLPNFVSGAADDTEDNIFIYRQVATVYTGGITLLNNQKLIGQGAAGTLAAVAGVTLPTHANALPAVAGTNPVINGGITLASGNTLNGLNSGDGASNGLINGASIGTLTVATVTINSNINALNVSTGSISGTFTSVSSAGGVSGVLLAAINGTWAVSGGSITGATGAAFSISGASAMSLSFNANITGGAGGAAVSISAGTSSVTFGGNVTQGANAAAISIFNGHATGTITFQTGTVSATNGTGLQFDNADGIYNFNGATTLNGGDAGIDILNGSTGTFSFGTGVAITNPTGTGFNVSGATAANCNVTYSGSISDNTAPAINIDNHDAGTITFQTGNVTASGGVGIAVNNCNGGTINFNQPTKSISTTTNTGVNLTSNTGATVNFGGGGLQITTTTGTGFNATGGGTVTVSTGGNPSTIGSGTGTALNIANTTIGAADVTFRSIASNGGSATGIIVDTTGSAGGLHVTGSGSAGSGGTIANKTGVDGATTTGNGIYLNSTTEVQLAWMQLNDFQNSAIRGFSVAGIKFENSVISGAVGDASGPIEGAMAFGDVLAVGTAGLTGNSLIDQVNISGSIEHHLEFYNQTGTMHLTITNSNIHDNTVASGSDGIQMEFRGTAQVFTLLDGNQFSNNKSQAIQIGALETANVHATISSNTVTRGTQGNEGIVLSNGGDSDLRVMIGGPTLADGNTISGFGGVAIFVGQVPGQGTASSLLEAIIQSNTVTSPASATNHAILAFVTSLTGQVSQARLLIDSNTVTYNSAAARAILVDAPDTGRTPEFHATVTNNLVTATDVNAVTMISVAARNGSIGHSDIRGNDVNYTTAIGVTGINVREASAGSNVLARGGSASNDSSVVIAANNPLSTTTVIPTAGDIPVVENNTIFLPATPTLPTLPPIFAKAGGVKADKVLAPAADLTQEQVTPILAEAIRRWEAAGATEAQIAKLREVEIVIEDLDRAYLGATALGDATVRLDINANGYGWYVDATPGDDSEFGEVKSATRLYTTPDQAPAGRMDLLTVLMHELGHVIGLDSIYEAYARDELMYAYLTTGERRLPAPAGVLDRLTAKAALEPVFTR